MKSNIWFDLSFAYECCIEGEKARYCSGINICQRPESVCDNKYLEFSIGCFLKAYHDEHQKNFRKCRSRAPGHNWHGCIHLQWSPLFTIVVAKNTHLPNSWNLIDKLTVMLTIKTRFAICRLSWRWLGDSLSYPNSYNCPIIMLVRSLGTKEDILTIQFPPTHPQVVFANICLEHRWPRSPAFLSHHKIVTRLRNLSKNVQWVSEIAENAQQPFHKNRGLVRHIR